MSIQGSLLRFLCRDTSAKSIISGIDQVFTMFKMPAYIHSDRGSAFMNLKVIFLINVLQEAAQQATTLPEMDKSSA